MGTVFSFFLDHSPEIYGTIKYDKPNLIPNFIEHESPRDTIVKGDVVDILPNKDSHIQYLEQVLISLMDIDPVI